MLEDVKEQETFDDLIRELLELTLPDALRERLDAKRRATETAINAKKRSAQKDETEERRSTAKQALLPRLAETQWKEWETKGKVETLGPRTVKWNVSSKKPRPSEGRISVVDGRGSEGTA